MQWKWCNTELSEDTFVLMLVSLHIEFVIEGKLTAMACKTGFFTAGSAELFTTKPERHLKRTRYT